MPPPLDPIDPDRRYGHAALIARMLRLAWRFRLGAVRAAAIQVVILCVLLSGLGLIGWGMDVVHAAIDADAPEPRGPFGAALPEGWSAMQQVLVLAAGVLGVAVVRALLDRTAQVWLAELVQDIVVALRREVYDKLERLSFTFFDTHESGSIINRVTGDVQAVRAFIDQVLINVLLLLLSLGFYLAYMLAISPLLTAACLATTPVLVGLTIWFSKVVRPEYVENRRLTDEAVRVLSEDVQGVQVVKGFALQGAEVEKFRMANDAVTAQQERVFFRVSTFQPVIQLLPQLNRIILLVVGGWLYLKGEIAFGSGLVVFAGLLGQFSQQVQGIAHIANVVQWSLTGAQRVFEVLDTPVDVASKADAVALPSAAGRVALEGVSFGYAGHPDVLHSVSLVAEPGQTVAILGATGAGKSTLLSLIPRFYDPREGRVLIDGHDARDLSLDDLRRSVGVVFQESFLFSHTVAENIAFGHPDATAEQVEAAARVAMAHEFIVDDLPDGYDTVLTEAGGNLSGGQRQRLAIARAVLLQPPVLLLDDPTASIDPDTEHEILAAMDEAMAGRTTFVVAHRLSTLRRADKVVVLDAGRVVERGTHDELMRITDGHYARAASLQAADDESRALLGLGVGDVE